MPAMEWTRRRIFAFRAAVFGDGNTTSSGMPQSAQYEPYEAEAAWSDVGRLAEAGVLLTPFHAFSSRYNVTLAPAVAAEWMMLVAGGLELPTGARAAALTVRDILGVDELGGVAGSKANHSLWAADALVASWAVQSVTAFASSASVPWSVFYPITARPADIDPDAHARALGRCAVEHAPTGGPASPLFRDREVLAAAVVEQRRYPALSVGLRNGSDDAALAATLFRSAARQPVPQVATFFNVAIGALGYVFAQREGEGVRRLGPSSRVPSSFRPMQCPER
jgi:hypothetical protein